ncbi:MAG: hypothetical protein GEV03_03835 [Streptosporangiales bacterium]|nr:hypothetical protein [Streptosporangiales bacterium]
MGTSTGGTCQCITFLTDYGLEDGFVASCHGVMVRLAPGIPIIDITHLVPPGDVRRGAAVLAQTVPYLPSGVHVAVVDPGVGTARRAVAVEAGDHVFVGPDNGLLSWAVRAVGGARRSHRLEARELWIHPVSHTFHGRDMFAPVAARLAGGLDLAEVGPAIPVDDLTSLPEPVSRMRDGYAEGEVLSADRFGNVQLSVRASQLSELGVNSGDTLAVDLARRTLTVPFRETFAAVSPGELVAYVDSAGFVAIAVNSGNAAQRLGLPPGAQVRLARFKDAFTR